MRIADQRISNKVFQIRSLQVARHHLSLYERAKRSRIPDFPAKLHAGYGRFQVLWVGEHIVLDPNGVERSWSRQTNLTSAFGACDASEQRPGTLRRLELGC